LITAKSILNDPEKIDMILHVGDLSYADGNQKLWDTWGQKFEFLSSRIPWMVLLGNHESEFYVNLLNPFASFRTRFRMPSVPNHKDRNLYWSMDYSYMHIISLSTESDYSPLSDQYKWFKKDISSVDRSKTPFIIVLFHRPFYNSNHSKYLIFLKAF
jgi:acid phosphatase type 7